MSALSRQSLPYMLNELQHEMNQLFALAPSANEEMLAQWLPLGWTPAVDIEERKNALIFSLEVPGIAAKDVEITIDNNVLTIKGEKKLMRKKEKENYSCCERYSGSFSRRFSLPANVDCSKIHAKEKHGVLEITIPKIKGTAAIKVDVESEEE